MPSWGSAHTKYTLGDPAKLGMSSLVVDVGAVNTIVPVKLLTSPNVMDG